MSKKLSALLAGLVVLTASANAAELNAYTIMPEKYASQIFAQFTKDTGIKVNFLRFSTGEALARLTAEKGNPQVDVLLGGPADMYAAGVTEGILEAYRPANSDAISSAYRDPNNYWTGIGLIPLCFLTNTKFLEKNKMQAPTKWADLLDPRYKNNLQMADARTSGTATERIYSLVKVMGEDEAFKFQKAMNANVQMYTKSGAGGAMPIATGQCASGIFYIVDALDIQQQGYPVTITYPEDGVSFGIEATGVVKGGKNNAEAKKFVDWATSKKFAEFIVANKINYVPTRNDVKTSNPILDLTKIKTISVDVTWKGEKRKEFTQRWINEVIK
ncbi:ABC transporter substrate-binding protein [Parasutterella secunda]|uniref:ABC transporter substrate-binding protein n=1 Tax=Parasutterella secunda TaxID=626947 RepID=UPI00201111CE|nr:ABC transporter substrate-binding protein [Parasutterella secunda]MCL1597220.1 ABC transporter substrate-binding protein [Parasutterella secunda]MCR8919826.1 ABC transporter substrate-binding protein [Parasutterella secunda]MDM8087977.1 ABC transporter substrate-binding protein [Parasutterella secunda]MDM8227266.1 ABC transporter substrate-binding protein [Parasutterella secunda]